MDKVDLKKEFKSLYNPKARDWELVSVPEMQFLMIDGQGDPNTSLDYSQAVEALFSLSYACKFMSKKVLERDYTVLPLEGLWTADGHEGGENDKSKYRWTMMIMQPDWISDIMCEQARQATAAKKSPPALAQVRFERYDEGQSLQLLHIGSYDDEAPKLARLHTEVMPARGLTFNGRHHEIYLSDPRRTDASKLKTILRQPVTSI